MADTPDVYQQMDAAQAPPSIPQDDRLAPILQQVRSTIQPEDDGSTWADPALAAIQQHVNATATVDANTAAGNQFTHNLNAVRQNMVGMVQDDPSSAPLAMRLTPRLVAPMVYSAGMDDDTAEGVHQSLVSDIQGQVAHAAVMRMADIHADGARQLLDQMSPYVTPEAKTTLGGYIDTLQAARSADDAARQLTLGAASDRASQRAAYQFGSTLLDPRTEQVAFPPDFLASLVRNQAINPADKSAVFNAYNRLTNMGDPTTSDPYVVRQMLQDIADPNTNVAHADIANQVGSGLRYADAVMLHGMNLQRTPEGIGAVQQLGSVLDHAQSTLSPGLDPAGNAAYSRFVNWLLPSYRRTGPLGLVPGADPYLFNNMPLDSFRATHNDAVAAPPGGPKNSLGNIFMAQNTRPGETPIGDTTDPALLRGNRAPAAPVGRSGTIGTEGDQPTLPATGGAVGNGNDTLAVPGQQQPQPRAPRVTGRRARG